MCKYILEENLNNNINYINIEIEKEINEIYNNCSKDIYFYKIIDLILTKLHEELNYGKGTNYIKGDCNENSNEDLSFTKFKMLYENNKSFIQELFFGIKETIIHCNSCGAVKYYFNIYKFIYFEIQDQQKTYNLQNEVFEWENKHRNKKRFCEICNKDLNFSFEKKIIEFSDILIIIIINNKDKIKIDFNDILKTTKYEYKLICYITDSKNENNINIHYKSDNKWYIIEDMKNIKEYKGKITSINLLSFYFLL